MLNLQMEEIKKDDEIYQRFLADLSSSQERVRVDAISRIPELLVRKGQHHSDITPLSVIWRSMGFGQEQIYAKAVRAQVKQLLLYGTTEAPSLSQWESQSLVNALLRTPPSAWFEDNRYPSEATLELNWLWSEANFQVNSDLVAFSRTLFNSAKLKGVNFTGLNLCNAEFVGLTCKECRFERSNLSGSVLLNATFENSFFDYTNLDDAKLTGVRLTKVSFYGTSLKGISLQKSIVLNSQFHLPDVGPSLHGVHSDLRGASFKATTFTECQGARGASFVGAQFDDVRFYRCNLAEASFRGASLSKTIFDGSSLKQTDLSDVWAQSASLVNVDLTGATFNRSNFLEADLTGAIGLNTDNTESSDSERFLNLNIASVKGLDAQVRLMLIQSGAVELSCDYAWNRYKRAGYPFETWLAYRSCPSI